MAAFTFFGALGARIWMDDLVAVVVVCIVVNVVLANVVGGSVVGGSIKKI